MKIDMEEIRRRELELAERQAEQKKQLDAMYRLARIDALEAGLSEEEFHGRWPRDQLPVVPRQARSLLWRVLPDLLIRG